MELHLNSSADICFISGSPFTKGDRVVSFLVRDDAGEYARFDCRETLEREKAPEGEILCRWTRTFKPVAAVTDHDKELKMSAETLFLSLTSEEPEGDGPDENADLKRFLALMLERKRVLKNRGTNRESGTIRYEHMPSKQMIEVPGGEMDVEFFMSMRDKLGVLLGEPAVDEKATQEEKTVAGPTSDE
jgi:hypothetical protein